MTTCAGRSGFYARKNPASSSDLPNSYRAIQALSVNPVINETAIVVAQARSILAERKILSGSGTVSANSYCVGGQSALNIGKNLEDLVQAGGFKDGPEIFLHRGERKFATVFLSILHSVDKNGQAGAVQIGDLGKIDDHAFGFVGNDRTNRCSDLWREVEIDFTIKRQYLCRWHFRPPA